jgi:hypothetical protein
MNDYEDDDDINVDDDNNIVPLDPSQNQQQQQQAAPPTIDHNAIAATVAQTMQQFQSQNAPQRQYTPEELAQHFQIWNPDDRFVNELNKLSDAEAPYEERVKLLHGMRDGIMQQAFRAAQLYVEQQMGSLKQEMAPALEYAQQQQATKLMNEFHGKYPSLKGYEELVDSITAKLSAQGFRPKSKDEAYDKVAQIAEQVLKKANPSFVLGKTGGAKGKPPMAGTNMGGFASAGGGGDFASNPQRRGGLAKIFQ